jgi:histone-binding protein RBBP4
MIWDLREKSNSAKGDKKPLFEIVAHTNEVYSLDFSPFNEFLLLSGSADETASVWDLRNLTRSLSTVNG